MTSFVDTSVLRRGATYTVVLRDDNSQLTGATVRMVLKRAPGDDNDDIAVFSITAMAHVDPSDTSTPPGWSGTLSATQTAALAPGNYAMDARLELGGVVYQTEAVQIVVSERVTEAS